MQDDLTRAEHYGTLATSMLRTAELEENQRRRAALLYIANEYAFLAGEHFPPLLAMNKVTLA